MKIIRNTRLTVVGALLAVAFMVTMFSMVYFGFSEIYDYGFDWRSLKDWVQAIGSLVVMLWTAITAMRICDYFNEIVG